MILGKALGENFPSRSDVRSPTSTSTEVRSPTSTSTEVRSPTSTSTEVRSPTSTSTDAYTQGNITVTGGAGAGATHVIIYSPPPQQPVRADEASNLFRSVGSATRMQRMIRATGSPRVPGTMPGMIKATGAPRAYSQIPSMMRTVNAGEKTQAPLTGAADTSKVWMWFGLAALAGGVAAGLHGALRD